INVESWKYIWKSWAPPRVRFFHWLADQDRCWTADRLA
uniref:Reverse transcriptase zinc-binding domain-containing protein n=1 Tax=Aegilops tauschii subsp. strangulata TaxID=200361 RepID=A0A453EV98_AEGTS